jgi:predicted metal-dependent hydrolase
LPFDLDYKLVFSKRRTVSLSISRDGVLTVRAPKRLPISFINKVLAEKRSWIEKHLRRMENIKRAKHQYLDGEKFWYLGRQYPLMLVDSYLSKLKFVDNVFLLSRHKTQFGKQLFIDWYAKQAKEIIFPRAKYFAELMKVKYRRISITSAQTRWGSCSSGKTINFSWRLIMASQEAVDATIVHELAHLIHHNHSKAFWDKVSEFYPSHKQAKKWLNTHAHFLQI